MNFETTSSLTTGLNFGVHLYKQGFIYPEVWQAWGNGMRFFRQNLRIKELWEKELKSGSYYGLCFEN